MITSPAITEFIQKAEFQAAGFATFARIVEDAAVTRFKANAKTGRRALENVIDKVMEEIKMQ
jgi:hypothetical protein